jgi:hypothetical protein
MCGAPENDTTGRKGYCEMPQAGGPPLCKPCPDKLDPSDKEKNPRMFKRCSE